MPRAATNTGFEQRRARPSRRVRDTKRQRWWAAAREIETSTRFTHAALPRSRSARFFTRTLPSVTRGVHGGGGGVPVGVAIGIDVGTGVRPGVGVGVGVPETG